MLARKRNAAVARRRRLVRAPRRSRSRRRRSVSARSAPRSSRAPLPDVDPGAGEGRSAASSATGAPLVVVRGREAPRARSAAGSPAARLADASAAGRVVRGLPDRGARAPRNGRADRRGAGRPRLPRRRARARSVARRHAEPARPRHRGRGRRARAGPTPRARARRLGRRASPVPDGIGRDAELGKIDVATSRSGATSLRARCRACCRRGSREDLRRRDFTVNAMAIELSSGEFGLIDPLGGRLDLARRRLRVLHPLSYVEDPTRIFRAARYAARLGLAPDRATISAQALALRLVPYAALSGQRIAAELELILSEPQAGTILLQARALRSVPSAGPELSVRGRRVGAVSARCRRPCAWARGRSLDADAVGLRARSRWPASASSRTAARSSRGSASRVVRWPRSSGRTPAPRGARRGARRGRRAERAGAQLRGCAPTELAWLWLTGDRAVRSTVDWFASLDPRVASLERR